MQVDTVYLFMENILHYYTLFVHRKCNHMWTLLQFGKQSFRLSCVQHPQLLVHNENSQTSVQYINRTEKSPNKWTTVDAFKDREREREKENARVSLGGDAYERQLDSLHIRNTHTHTQLDYRCNLKKRTQRHADFRPFDLFTPIYYVYLDEGGQVVYAACEQQWTKNFCFTKFKWI